MDSVQPNTVMHQSYLLCIPFGKVFIDALSYFEIDENGHRLAILLSLLEIHDSSNYLLDFFSFGFVGVICVA